MLETILGKEKKTENMTRSLHPGNGLLPVQRKDISNSKNYLIIKAPVVF